MNSEISLYIHIPFCRSKCYYCDFYSINDGKKIDEYCKALINQIKKTECHEKKRSVKTVYIGGGTPSILSCVQIENIMNAINETFDLKNCIEQTIECNPESVTEEKLKIYKKLGINRLSIGTQSMNDCELQALGRIHTAEMTKTAYEMAIKNGFENISIDVMLAIPEQTMDTLKSTLNDLMNFQPKPTHISAYLLKIEEKTIFSKKNMQEINEDIQEEMYLYTAEFLAKNGYEHYEVSNFAQKNKKSIHNSNYWQQNEYLAFGTAAYGFTQNKRWHYDNNINEFIKNNGNIKKIIDEELNEQQLAEEKIILGLRTSDGIDAKILNEKASKYVDFLIKNGLIYQKNNKISLNSKGFLVSNGIIFEIISLLF